MLIRISNTQCDLKKQLPLAFQVLFRKVDLTIYQKKRVEKLISTPLNPQ